MKHVSPSVHRFEAIEQLGEWHRELEWPLEYRQIEAGPLTSTFTNVDGDNWFLLEEQSSRQLEVDAASPESMFMMAVVEGNRAEICGRVMREDRLLLQVPNSEMRVTIPAGVKATQVGVTEKVFEELVDAVAPDLDVPRGCVTFFDAPGRLASVRRAMREAIFTPSSRRHTREEAVSSILTALIVAASDRGPVRSSDMRRAAARRALDKARDYIEANLKEAIHVSSLCHYSGTTLRTLERIFSREMGLSPKQYIMARRLNAVRLSLLEVGDGHDHPVTEVAQNHSFTHLGRFAADYRRLFGEYPKETLQER